MTSLRGEKLAESSISLFESCMDGRCYIKVIENAVILKMEKNFCLGENNYSFHGNLILCMILTIINLMEKSSFICTHRIIYNFNNNLI